MTTRTRAHRRYLGDGVYVAFDGYAIVLSAENGVTAHWNALEHYDQLPNGSRAYIRGLKAQDATVRYGKFRGLTLARDEEHA